VSRARWSFAENELVVGTLCRLSDRRKGVDDFIEMARTVAADCPPARFLIVGDGVLRGELEAHAREAGLGSRIVFAGWEPASAPSYAAMDVFVMASTHEGGPTSLLEAMAMGLPVVATRVGMVPEVVKDGVTGFICSPSSPDQLATAVTRLLQDQHAARRVGVAAREFALQHFSVHRMVDQYIDLFGRLSGRTTKPVSSQTYARPVT
jgi:glycosyltransferase involved in cell wall biosynthesis